MDVGQPKRRSLIGRVVEGLALAGALGAAFASGIWYDARDNGRSAKSSAGETAGVSVAVSPPTAAKATSLPGKPRTVDPRQPEPLAVQARAAIIRRDSENLRNECQRAGGNWEKWQSDTEPYRSTLKSRIDSLKKIPSGQTEPWYAGLAGLDNFPLFEIDARKNLGYIFDPATLDGFRRERSVVAATRWLRQRGIDLIFVPVPKMAEVYMDHFLKPCPADGIIAPHARRTLLELLDEDVEVVDAMKLFRDVRDLDSEYLYNALETHWAPRGMRVTAKEIADRIVRYKFGASARYALPIVHTTCVPYPGRDLFGRIGGIGALVVTPEQRERATKVQPASNVEISLENGERPPDDPGSPVLVVGHSYVWAFREQLIKELNLLVNTRIAANQTTQFFGDFLREPELLEHCRVVVWVTTEQHMTDFHAMPGPIMATLQSAK